MELVTFQWLRRRNKWLLLELLLRRCGAMTSNPFVGRVRSVEAVPPLADVLVVELPAVQIKLEMRQMTLVAPVEVR